MVGGWLRLVVMFCGAYDYEPFVVYGNDVPRPLGSRQLLIEFDEFNMILVPQSSIQL